jgi:phosphonate transport system substrate-binding protein
METDMRSLTRRAAMALALVPALGLAPRASHAAEKLTELNFGLVSTEGSANLKAQWEPFLADMSKAIGLKVVGSYPSDYAGVIEAMRFNKVQIGWFGNASAIEAVDRSDGEVFMQKVYSDGSKGYYSILIVNKDGPITSFDQMLKTPGIYNFGNGDPNSTSGFLIPSYYAWAKHDIDVRKFFKNVVTSNHEANLLAVAMRTVDVATNNTEDYAKFVIAQPERAAMIKEIWRSPIIPSDPIVWRKDLPPDLKAKVKTFFLTYGTDRPGADVAHEKAVLKALGGWGPFSASSDAQLLPVRQVAAFKDKLTLESDTTMPAAEKAQKLKVIDAHLHELDAQIAKAHAS